MAPKPEIDVTHTRAVLEGYVELRQQVAIMRELAHAGEWDALVERQSTYLALGDRIRQLDAQAELDPQAAQRKAELLEVILTDDLAIRERLLARRQELGQLMESSRRQRDLNRSYGKQAAAAADSGNSQAPERP